MQLLFENVNTGVMVTDSPIPAFSDTPITC
ncbi:hypothetical protein BH11BAC3_BH11BAC3_10140 [soil metagenome]